MNAMKRVELRAAAAALAGAALAPFPAVAWAQSIKVLSSRPDTVSGGDALVAIDLPSSANAASLKVRVSGRDVTSSFSRKGRAMIGLVSGLSLGRNVVTAAVGGRVSRLALVNHSRNGPIFSGPHQTPFICETDQFKLPDGSTMGPPVDSDCNAPTKVMFLYHPTSGRGFKLLPAGSTLPADMSKTTTLDGRTVNYIVRLETGTINRAIYQIAILYDPSRDPPIGPTADYNGWNRRAVFIFGGGATAGHHQGDHVGDDLLNGPMLSRGFAVMSSSLSVFAFAGSDVLSAETASMVKEHFIKTFGPPRYVFGWGGSGGSMQQNLIANNYPGILDGIVPGSSFPDLYSMEYPEDCALMARAFAAGREHWTDEQKRAASGLNTWGTCVQWNQFFMPEMYFAKQADPKIKFPGFKDSNCNAVVPRALTYDPVSNPRGARCDVFSAARNSVGFDPKTGATYRTYDNVGLQYGLKAYRDGAISAEQFVELNENIGGIDNDGNFRAARAVASPIGLRRMFEFGRINEGGNLGRIPVIDLRGNPILLPNVHDAINSEIMRARLIRSNGNARGQLLLRGNVKPTLPGSGTVSGSAPLDLFALLKMDEWLSNIEGDHRRYRSAAARVVADRPSDLVTDVCIMADGRRIDEASSISNTGECGRQLPYFSEPRLVAGEPLTRDVLKCHLRPFRQADYPHMPQALVARLKAVFATGVCDYSRRSVGYVPLKGTWLSYPKPGVAESLN